MKNISYLILSVFIMVLLCNCSNSYKKNTIVFKEQAGITRVLEYVNVSLFNHNEQVIYLEDISTGAIIRGEKLNLEVSAKDSTTYIFPISIKANEEKTYILTNSNKEFDTTIIDIIGEDVSLKVESKHFIADFNTNEAKIKKGLYPGQLAGIFIKSKDILLQRGLNNMHWAPNFQKEELDYKTIGHVDSKNIKVTQKNAYIFEMRKFGHVPNYEEIDLYGQYNFFAELPYFVYTSTMSFNKDTELILLRNDEMTIDSLFTHLVYPDDLGKVAKLPLYNMRKFDSLTKTPLADNIPWLGFINEPLGYGFVSLRLSYNNQNNRGVESPLYKPHTKISESRGNGRYWNRRLIHDHKTLVPKGSRYYEKNAYLVIDSLDKIDEQINYYHKCIMNPIVVSYPIK